MTSSYVFDSLILLLDSVIEIAYFCNMRAASGANSAELSSVVVGVIAISAITIGSAVAAVSIVSIHTFFGFLLGLGSPGDIFLFND